MTLGFTYNKLWHLLLDKGMNKSRLRENGIHSSTIARMVKGKTISTETLDKLCRILDCQPCDIAEHVPDEEV